MKKIYLSWICIAITSFVFSQEKINYESFGGIKVKAELSGRLNKPYLKTYGNEFLGRYIKINFYNQQRFNNSPEEVLHKIFRSTSDKDIRSAFQNNKLKITDYKLQSSQTDSARNFLVLRLKLTFTTPDKEISVIKYTQFVDSVATKDFVLQVAASNNAFTIDNSTDYSDAAYCLANVNSDEMWFFLKRMPADDSEKRYVSESLWKQVKDADGTLNLTKLADLIRERKGQGKKGFID